MTGETLVALAREIATRAHDGQVDRAGLPYIAHPQRIAAAFPDDPAAAAVAWLHDVLEDTPVTEADLSRAGLPEEVIAAVVAITHLPGEERVSYYRRVRANPIALPVKDADISDNTMPERLALLDEATRSRLVTKYAAARQHLGLSS